MTAAPAVAKVDTLFLTQAGGASAAVAQLARARGLPLHPRKNWQG